MLDLGGTVALLLWGVHMVQTGVQRALGARLRAFLGRHLANRPSAFLAGLGVTVLLQSSTATGLMATRFAGDGLVALAPGLAVMLGANVGTTLIVQLLAFDVSLVAPILVLAGYVLFRRTRAGVRDFGRVFIGLGLLLLALHQFLALLGPITADAQARALLAALSSHTGLILLAGLVLAWAVHSSVATVLMAMSLAASGVLTLPAGIALTLGANVGSAINPLLAADRRDPAAQRLPLGNLLLRAAGALLLFAALPWLAPAVAAIEDAPARAIADFHSGINLLLALAAFPVLAPYARLLERLLPARANNEPVHGPRYLRGLEDGAPVSVQLGAAKREALRLADVLEEMIAGLRDALDRPSRRGIEDTRHLDDRLDRLNRAIKENLLGIDHDRLGEADNEKLVRILSFSINLEQAGDLIDRGLLDIASRRLERGLAFSPAGAADLAEQIDRLLDTLHRSTAVFLTSDAEAARLLASEKEAFRRLEEDAIAAHFARLRSGNVQTIETSALHLDALRDLKRVNSHLVAASAYPILKQRGDLLPTRLRAVE